MLFIYFIKKYLTFICTVYIGHSYLMNIYVKTYEIKLLDLNFFWPVIAINYKNLLQPSY